VSGSVDAGGIYSGGERSSSKFEKYRDMDNGFVGELSLRGEKKDQPYFFDFYAKNPARDDQLYEGAVGRYGLWQLDLNWDRTPKDLSNNAGTIFQQNGSDFTLPSTLRSTITTTPAGYLNNTAANCTGITSWTCPYPVGSTATASQPKTSASAQFVFIRDTINGLLRPVDLSFNTDVGAMGFKLTPTEALRFDVEYNNRRVDGYRAVGAQINNLPLELAIPLDNMTQEVKFGAEFARPAYAVQFNYTASLFHNDYQSYTWDNPLSTVTQLGTATTTEATARGEVSAPPDNTAHTLSLTARDSLPWWRTSVSGAFSYTMLRQDQTFLNNIATPGTGLTQTNKDDQGASSPNAQSNLVSGNLLLTSRPLTSLTATARYRYFELQNDTPQHTFTNDLSPSGVISTAAGTTNAAVTGSTTQERFTKQNAGFDLGWRPLRMVSFKTGYEYEHWNRGDFDGKSFSTDEHIAKAAVDVTPIDWFLGRLTYTYGDRYQSNYGADPDNPAGFYKFDYADRVRNRVDALLQFSPWETFTPSLNFGYANDNYKNSPYGLTDDTNFSVGAGLGWNPTGGLTFSADYTYELHDSRQAVSQATSFKNKSKDEFHTVNLNMVVDVVPKKFDINLGYGVTLGYTTITATNLNGTATPGQWDRIENVLQTARIIGRYRMTEKLSVRGGLAYERYTERNFAVDPMQPFIGNLDNSCSARSNTCASQSVFLGATQPNYESYTFAGFVRYDF
jgi:MtrB/PioB family decaheme-associated outer membrane protein